MVHKPPFHTTNDRQHTVAVLLLYSYLRTYSVVDTHSLVHLLCTPHVHRSETTYFKSNTILDRTARATRKRLWVSGGFLVASLNAIFCRLIHFTHTVQTYIHKHIVLVGATPIELTIRGARTDQTTRAIDTPQIWRPRRDPFSVFKCLYAGGSVYERQTKPKLDLKYFAPPLLPRTVVSVSNVRGLREIIVLITRARVIDPHAGRSVCWLRRGYPDVILA